MTILDDLDSWTATPAASFASGPATADTRKPAPRKTRPTAGNSPAQLQAVAAEAHQTASPVATSLLASYIEALPASTSIPSAPFPSLCAYPIGKLQDEIQLWGFRTSSDRAVLTATLKRVWEALVQQKFAEVSGASDSEEELIISLAQQHLQQDGIQPGEDGEEDLLYASSPTSYPSGKDVALLPLSGQSALLTPHLSALLRCSITSDERLYHRILLMEPIPFEEIWSLVQRDLGGSLNPGGVLESALAEGETDTSEARSDDSDVPLTASAKRKAPSGPRKKTRRARRKKPVNSAIGIKGIKGRLIEEVKVWLDLRGITWYEGELIAPKTRHP